DVFYSSENFLDNTLAYLRGISPEELLNESPEMYPVRTALSYAAHLDAALEQYSGFRGHETARAILRAEKLIVFKEYEKPAVLSGPSFRPLFETLLDREKMSMDPEHPMAEADRLYRLDFFGADDEWTLLYFGGERLYYGRQESIENTEDAPKLLAWLEGLFGTPRYNRW
ncbi:MAG: hypothetical protein J5827_02215, partial [Oscillospiraceae bacterium]|nr:hypothetical protein [Oscillospiraceae bacterium]